MNFFLIPLCIRYQRPAAGEDVGGGGAGSCFNSAPADNFCTINQAFGFFQIHSGGVVIRIANEALQALKVTELLCRVSDQRGEKATDDKVTLSNVDPQIQYGQTHKNSDSQNQHQQQETT